MRACVVRVCVFVCMCMYANSVTDGWYSNQPHTWTHTLTRTHTHTHTCACACTHAHHTHTYTHVHTRMHMHTDTHTHTHTRKCASTHLLLPVFSPELIAQCCLLSPGPSSTQTCTPTYKGCSIYYNLWIHAHMSKCSCM